MSIPAFEPDDPRLTAYALGECDPAEREAVERLLAHSPAARAEGEQIGNLARALEAEYCRENEAYQATRRDEPLPGKVVAFTDGRRAGRSAAMTFVWKIAAVLFVLGVLGSLVWRRPSSPPTVAFAPPPPAVMAPAPAPAAQPSTREMPAAGGIARAETMTDTDQETSTSGSSTDTAEAATKRVDPVIAMTHESAPADAATDRPASQSMAMAPENIRASKASVQRTSVAPGAARPNAGSAVIDRASAPLADQIARCVVRVRAGDGSYLGGVLVTTDGWVLAADSLSREGAPPTVIAADQREIPTTISHGGSGGGFCLLRTDLEVGPAVVLATTLPADKSVLSVASTNRRTGLTRLLRARAVVSGATVRVLWDEQPPTDNETSLIFDARGGLLAMTTAPPITRSAVRAKTTPARPASAELFVRPFSPAEQDWLQSVAGGLPR